MADYPSTFYSPRDKENASGVVYDADKKSVIFAEDIEKLDAEVVAIETELGKNAKGAAASVSARIAALEGAGSGDHAELSNLTYADSGHVGFEPTVTKGNLTATAPAKVSGSRQVIGGAADISVDYDNDTIVLDGNNKLSVATVYQRSDDYDDLENTSGLAGIIMVRKTADESVSSSTVLQDDNHLTVTLAANTVYAFDASIFVTTAAIPKFKFQWIEPDGTWYMNYLTTDNTGNEDGRLLTDSSAAATVAVYAVALGLSFFGIISTGASGGTFKLQWAQGTSNATNTTVKAGSFMRFMRFS